MAQSDGYSRRILWLEVGSSNNNPRIVGKYFLDCVVQVKGTPRICRGDAGTENVNIAAMQPTPFGGTKAFCMENPSQINELKSGGHF